MEKDAAGCPSLPSHYGLTNPGISRDLASRLPYCKHGLEGCSRSGAIDYAALEGFFFPVVP